MLSSFCMHITHLFCPSFRERHHYFLSAQAHSTSFPWFELTKGPFKANTKFIGDINHFTFKDRLEVNFQKRSLIISRSHFPSVSTSWLLSIQQYWHLYLRMQSPKIRFFSQKQHHNDIYIYSMNLWLCSFLSFVLVAVTYNNLNLEKWDHVLIVTT